MRKNNVIYLNGRTEHRGFWKRVFDVFNPKTDFVAVAINILNQKTGELVITEVQGLSIVNALMGEAKR